MLIIFIWNNKLFVEGNKDTSEAGETFKVVIDPGHGGSDVGATGISGLYEKDFTLSLSKKIKKILEKEEQIEVYMTREDDTFISTEDLYRPKFANELNADLYISIHGNTFSDSDVSGTESFYFHDESKYFADLIHRHVVNATGFNDRGVKAKDFFVVRYVDMPAVLLEIGYLTNPQEEQKMLDDGFQYSIATSIVDGIKEYLEIE
ncbi:N-acetylmuramoyl-L-alanine amidase [Clostridium sp. D2Q-14]|nr:N-acetylmuramoyl-L-alanine amidase [Anaeromonas gelatinilytica]